VRAALNFERGAALAASHESGPEILAKPRSLAKIMTSAAQQPKQPSNKSSAATKQRDDHNRPFANVIGIRALEE
jgi:hypothetical protein